MNWTELLTSTEAGAVYGFVANTILTIVLRNVQSRRLVITILKGIVGALEKATPAAVLLLAIWLQGCSMQNAYYRRAAYASFDEQLAMSKRNANRPAQQCQTIDNWHLGLQVGGIVVAPAIGVGAGVLAAADTSETVERVAIGTGLGAIATEAVLLAADGKLVSLYTERCQ